MRIPRLKHPYRAVSLVVSAGLLLPLSGCTLRDAPETPDQSTHVVLSPADAIVTAFGGDNLPGMLLSPDEQTEPLPKPELSQVVQSPAPVIHPSAEEWIRLYGDKSGEILLTPSQINDYNRRIIEDCPTVVDMEHPPKTMDGKTVREMIARYSMPSGQRYTKDGRPIDWAKRQKIEERRQNVPDTVTVRLGIVTNRCDLKGVPTAEGFYVYGDRHYSGIQETELIAGFPVWILHESHDGAFVFVQSYYYAGWISSESVAVCTEEEYHRFAGIRQSSYVTVTAPRLDLEGIRLDMGVTLPYIREDEASFTVALPSRDEEGRLMLREISLLKEDAVFGSLPYTWENTLNQAFAFLGTPYGWGGQDGNVDCSGFICGIYRCFGIYLPRNTGEQSQYNGTPFDLRNLSTAEKSAHFSAITTPATVHWTGHVMLYLGEKDGTHYVIHAPQGGQTVSVTALSMSAAYLCTMSMDG